MTPGPHPSQIYVIDRSDVHTFTRFIEEDSVNTKPHGETYPFILAGINHPVVIQWSVNVTSLYCIQSMFSSFADQEILVERHVR